LHGGPASASASASASEPPPSATAAPPSVPEPLLDPEVTPLELPVLLVLELTPLLLPLVPPLPLLPPLLEAPAPESATVQVPLPASSPEHAAATAGGNRGTSETHRYERID
jgi:hypothetical protein